MSGQYIKVNGADLYYEVQGQGEPLLLLHGAFGSLESFREMRPILAKHFRVFALDSRGHGRSSDGESLLNYALMASDLKQFLDQLGIPSAAFVGWSDGAITAMQLASNDPSRVRELVAMSANFSTSGLTDYAVEHICNTSLESLDPFTAGLYRRVSPNPEHLPLLVDKLKYMLLTEPNFTSEQLGRISCPTLIVSGEDEEFIRREHTLQLHAAIPNAELQWVKNAGHFILFERAPELSEIIVEFLTSKTARQIGCAS